MDVNTCVNKLKSGNITDRRVATVEKHIKDGMGDMGTMIGHGPLCPWDY